MKLLKRIWMGAGYLEGYGYHPGAGQLFILILVCGLAGTEKGGLWGFIGGSAIGSIFFLPIFFMGCYSRTKMYEEDMEQTFKILQEE